MSSSLLAEVLFFISSSSWFWYSIFGTDDTDFAGGHGVIAGVSDCLVPNEGDRFVFESPGCEYSYGYIELRPGSPHVADGVMRGDVLHIHIA